MYFIVHAAFLRIKLMMMMIASRVLSAVARVRNAVVGLMKGTRKTKRIRRWQSSPRCCQLKNWTKRTRRR